MKRDHNYYTHFRSVKIGTLTPSGFTETKTFRTTFIVFFLYIKCAIFTQIACLTFDVRFAKTFGS